MEKTNIRYVTKEQVPEEIDFTSIDVAFISLTKVLEPVKALMAPQGRMVCLVKPQFEAGREQVGKKGVVRDQKVHAQVIRQVMEYALSLGFRILELSFSPIKGPEGNIEYLLYLENGQQAGQQVEDYETLIRETVEQAHGALDHQ